MSDTLGNNDGHQLAGGVTGPFDNPDGTPATQASTRLVAPDYGQGRHDIPVPQRLLVVEADGTLHEVTLADLGSALGVTPRPITVQGYIITGQTISVANYGGAGGPSDAHQWQANGSDLPGQTGTTLTITPAIEGSQINLKVNGELSNVLRNFIPTDAGVEVWLDPAFDSDPLNLNRGTALTPWTVVGAVPPAPVAFANGVQAMHVTNGYLQQAVGEFPDLSNLTVVLGANPQTLTTDTGFKMNQNGGGGRSQMHLPWSDGRIYFDVQGMDDRFNTNGGFVVAGASFLLSYQNDPTTAYANVFRSNNPSAPFQDSAAFSSASVAGAIEIGKALSQSDQNTYMLDHIITARVLSTSAREKLEGYVAWKYGLEGTLPSAHPYKGAPA